MVSFPVDANDTPVFRGTGLMYTNKNNQCNNNTHIHDQKPHLYNKVKPDPDYRHNMMYLGGTDKHEWGAHWVVGNVRNCRRGVTNNGCDPAGYLFNTVALHGHQPICDRKCGGEWGHSKLPD